MKAAILEEPGTFFIRELPVPECPDGGLLVKIKAAAICSSDVNMIMNGHKALTYPRIPGHEMSGIIWESRSRLFKEGENVQIAPGIACGKCRWCIAGMEAGIGIFNGMSPKVHPNALGRILSQISFGTTLNIAASLASPVLPQYGVRGVYARELVNPVAKAMKEIGYKRAIVVHGLDGEELSGMDEASTLGVSIISELKENGIINEYSISPEDFGIKRASRESVAPLNDLKNEAARFVRLLNGREDGACLDIVCLNAALLLYMMDITASIKDGFNESKEIIKSGKAIDKLKSWVQIQQSQEGNGMSKLNSILST